MNRWSSLSGNITTDMGRLLPEEAELFRIEQLLQEDSVLWNGWNSCFYKSKWENVISFYGAMWNKWTSWLSSHLYSLFLSYIQRCCYPKWFNNSTWNPQASTGKVGLVLSTLSSDTYIPISHWVMREELRGCWVEYFSIPPGSKNFLKECLLNDRNFLRLN